MLNQSSKNVLFVFYPPCLNDIFKSHNYVWPIGLQYRIFFLYIIYYNIGSK